MKSSIIALLLLASLTACKQAPYNESQKTLLKIRDSEFDPKGYNQLKEPTVLVTPTNHMLLLGANGKFVLYCISEESCVRANDATPASVYGTFQQVMALLAKHTTEQRAAMAKNPVAPDGNPVTPPEKKK